MPAGLTEALTRPELIDLVRFLSQLGKIGVYSVGTDRVLRRWQVLEPTPELMPAFARDGVPGLVTRRAIAQLAAGLHDGGRSAAPLGMGFRNPGRRRRSPRHWRAASSRSRVPVRSSCRSTRLTHSRSGSTAAQIEPTGDAPRSLIVDLARGAHTMIVVVDLTRRHEGVRCVLEDVPGSPARAQAVLGK